MHSRRVWQWLALLLALALAPVARAADESAERQAIALEMQAAWLRQDFAALDRLYRGYRDTSARLPSGVFKAARMFYVLPALIGAGLQPNDPGYEEGLRQLAARLQRWQQQQPTSSLAALAMTYASIWQAQLRGQAAAAAANDNLLRAGTGPEHDPAWYYARFQLAPYLGSSPQEQDRLLDEASQRFPGFYDLYFVAAERAAPERIEKIADLAARRTRATEGEAAYARVYWSVGQDTDYAPDIFGSTRADWARMRSGFEQIVRSYPENWNLNNFAWFACQARDAATLKALLARIGDRVDRELWEPQRLNRCREIANDR